MIKFEELFIQSKGQPITVDGMTYVMLLRLNVAKGETLHFSVEKLIQSPRQGIRIDSDKPVAINGKSDKAHSCWLTVAPSEFVVECHRDCTLIVRNIWDYGDGVEQSWHAGGAMVCEKTEGAIRVRCNSTLQNDAAMDLVFRIQKNNPEV